jgi:molecular chaperone Hsp33
MVQTNSDFCLRGVSEDGSVKLWLAQTTNLCEEGRRRHDAWSVAAAALGRLLTAGVFFGLNLKGENDSVTLRINGDGPLGSLGVVAECDGAVRGYVAYPQVDIPRRKDGHLDVGSAIGKGTLTVIKDMGFGEPYSGTVELVSGEIGDDIAQYYLESEQTPAAVGLGVQIAPNGTVGAAGGFLLQVLPHADEMVIKQLELNLANLIPVSQMVADGFTLEEMANEVMLGVPWRELERKPLEYRCTCSKERLRGALMSMGYKELKSLYDEKSIAGEDVEVVCRFCGEKYLFNKEEMRDMVDELDRERFRNFAASLQNQLNVQVGEHEHSHAHGEGCSCGCHHHEHDNVIDVDFEHVENPENPLKN